VEARESITNRINEVFKMFDVEKYTVDQIRQTWTAMAKQAELHPGTIVDKVIRKALFYFHRHTNGIVYFLFGNY